MPHTQAKPISVVIVDDHGLLRSVMTLALSALDGVEVVGQAANGREAVDIVIEQEPDVVLMDILMPLLDGLEATRGILRDYPRARVVVLTGVAEPDAVLDVLRAGACGLIAKSAELAEVEIAVRAAAAGGVYVSPDLAGPVLARIAARPADEAEDELARLSTREREIVQLIGEGESTRDIAEGLFISPKTVAQHKSNIVKKIGLKNTRELQILAAKRTRRLACRRRRRAPLRLRRRRRHRATQRARIQPAAGSRGRRRLARSRTTRLAQHGPRPSPTIPRRPSEPPPAAGAPHSRALARRGPDGT